MQRGESITVVTAQDFTSAEFWRGLTTTWPDQLICYNPPPDPVDPESPPLWNGCKTIGWGEQRRRYLALAGRRSGDQLETPS